MADSDDDSIVETGGEDGWADEDRTRRPVFGLLNERATCKAVDRPECVLADEPLFEENAPPTQPGTAIPTATAIAASRSRFGIAAFPVS